MVDRSYYDREDAHRRLVPRLSIPMTILHALVIVAYLAFKLYEPSPFWAFPLWIVLNFFVSAAVIPIAAHFILVRSRWGRIFAIPLGVVMVAMCYLFAAFPVFIIALFIGAPGMFQAATRSLSYVHR